jgi:hypothetical protein
MTDPSAAVERGGFGRAWRRSEVADALRWLAIVLLALVPLSALWIQANIIEDLEGRLVEQDRSTLCVRALSTAIAVENEDVTRELAELVIAIARDEPIGRPSGPIDQMEAEVEDLSTAVALRVAFELDPAGPCPVDLREDP